MWLESKQGVVGLGWLDRSVFKLNFRMKRPSKILVITCVTVAVLLIQAIIQRLGMSQSVCNRSQTRAALLGSVEPASAQEATFAPLSVYKPVSIHGFTVLIHPAVLKHPQEAKAMRQELDSQLAAIVRVMPAQPLSALQNVRIWVEWANRREGAAEFHPSAVWLSQHGYNPDKAGSVEISNACNFVEWSRTAQPWMLLHELAHAYHFLVLGETYAGIQTAYQHAMQQGLYQSVAYIKGGKQNAYALTNEKEYFAELSEAYFGKNDFYPFTRAELKTYDPTGYQLMEAVWGKPRKARS